jgi:hypothetical protein
MFCTHVLYSYTVLMHCAHALYLHPALKHCSYTLCSYTVLNTVLLHCTHILFLHTALINCTHILHSYYCSHTQGSSPVLTHCTHTLYSYTVLILLCSYTVLIHCTRTLYTYYCSHALYTYQHYCTHVLCSYIVLIQYTHTLYSYTVLQGGAIYADASSIEVHGTLFDSNAAGIQARLYFSVVAEAAQLKVCICWSQGGAVYMTESNSPHSTLTNCAFNNNTSPQVSMAWGLDLAVTFICCAALSA